MSEKIETIIIGGGQGGLATSYYLAQNNHKHIILEQAAQPANAWRNERWDSFTFVTPNWSIKMPGAEYAGAEPDAFMPRADIVRYFENYVDRFHLPIRFNARVNAVEQNGNGYRVGLNDGEFEAQNVVIATGLFQKPKVPAFSANIARDILQLPATRYRNPGALPPGAVLVVGSAQSGCQIAEELYQSGRTVYLCIGNVARVPRRYRGKDIVTWLDGVKFFERTPEMLPSLKMRFAGNPQVSGARGGHALNLHQFARDGVVLLGHLQNAQGDKIFLAPDLIDSLARTDKAEADIIKMVDEYIANNQIDAPAETLPQLRDGFDSKIITELNLRDAGITSIIWAAGFAFDFRWIKPAILDDAGFPIQKSGIAEQRGLYFVGLPWLPGQKSGILIGVGANAAKVAQHIIGNCE